MRLTRSARCSSRLPTRFPQPVCLQPALPLRNKLAKPALFMSASAVHPLHLTSNRYPGFAAGNPLYAGDPSHSAEQRVPNGSQAFHLSLLAANERSAHISSKREVKATLGRG